MRPVPCHSVIFILISFSNFISAIPINITAPNSHESWNFVCGSEKLAVVGVRVSVVEVSTTSKWLLIETKVTDEHGRASLNTRAYKDAKTEDFILKIVYSYEPAVDQGDETPFLVANENDNVNEDSALTEELLLDEDVRRSGVVALTSVPCLAFVNTKRALDDFRNATGRKGHPAGPLRIVFSQHVGDVFRGPFAAVNTIQLPAEYQLNYSAALQALGHTVRHALDGSYSHFLTDMARYFYAQSHSCKEQTNAGYAFDKGWADYWANLTSCFVAQDRISSKGASRIADYNIEGRVAAAFYDLGTKCHGTSNHRKRFYDLLAEHPLGIHSFEEFLKLHKMKYNCGLL